VIKVLSRREKMQTMKLLVKFKHYVKEVANAEENKAKLREFIHEVADIVPDADNKKYIVLKPQYRT
jgi:hypothetical protein